LIAIGVALYLALRDGEAAPISRRARLARMAAWGTWGALWLASMPIASNRLTALVEMRGPDLGAALAGEDLDRSALVVLSAGLRTYDQSLPPRERLDAATTQRVLTAARLWHEHPFGLVILSGAPEAESVAMQDLAITLGVPADRVVREPRSINTRENARNSAAILRERGARAVVVVTSATHLRRAVRDFERVGVRVIPAAADIIGRGRFGIEGILPSSSALFGTHVALHEILGMIRG
jgi:uncharacterized SAM-binding protein YcdF (DUF218 family)